MHSATLYSTLSAATRPTATRRPALALARRLMSTNLNRPAPPPLPREQQREYEELVRSAQAPLAPSSARADEVDLSLHPDARAPLVPEFDGEVNPKTGERGGPKREPVGRWGESEDWSFKGRVSDF